MDGREAMVTPERTLLSTLRRESLDMVDTQSVPKKSPMREEKLLFRGLGALRRRGCGGFRGVRHPGGFFPLGAGKPAPGWLRGGGPAHPADTGNGLAPTAG